MYIHIYIHIHIHIVPTFTSSLSGPRRLLACVTQNLAMYTYIDR